MTPEQEARSILLFRRMMVAPKRARSGEYLVWLRFVASCSPTEEVHTPSINGTTPFCKHGIAGGCRLCAKLYEQEGIEE